MLSNTVDRTTVDKMVRHFYAKILKDDLVGHYFTRALGEDLNGGKWHEHHNTLNDFWLLMMTGKRGYGGNPFPPHAFIGELYPETFERWLELFHETVHEFFTPEIAEKFYKKAQIIALEFRENLDIDEEDDD
ncbi:group III truncated hemoglobin [Sulfurimonas sp.]|nr:group III truncated hemoglobin [Sulfurimonas sp.]